MKKYTLLALALVLTAALLTGCGCTDQSMAGTSAPTVLPTTSAPTTAATTQPTTTAATTTPTTTAGTSAPTQTDDGDATTATDAARNRARQNMG